MYLTLKSDAIQMHLKCMLLLYIMYLHVRLSHSNKGYLLTYLFKDSRIYVTRLKQSTVQFMVQTSSTDLHWPVTNCPTYKLPPMDTRNLISRQPYNQPQGPTVNLYWQITVCIAVFGPSSFLWDYFFFYLCYGSLAAAVTAWVCFLHFPIY